MSEILSFVPKLLIFELMIKVERNFFKKICLLGANNYQLVYNENFFLFSLKWKANKFRVADKILNEIIVLVLNI